ncbi:MULTISPECIES: hypothetical protein [unclassified Wolbachia]|uniref:hypothetical protein n=1 Tax=unclassified Wolbachia TaxID=2640676 RepID=UPI002225BE1E|nr:MULTISPECIES: hypothetical protein [unclassified Wolbachia]
MSILRINYQHKQFFNINFIHHFYTPGFQYQVYNYTNIVTISVANGVMKVADTGIHSSFFLDSSVSYFHDRKIGYLNDKRELLVRHVIPALDAGIQIKTSLK